MAVSVVINGARSGTQVSQETRRRILLAAEELQYRPNAIARSLARRRSDIIGFYNGYSYVDTRCLFLAEVMAGLQEGCSRHRKDLLMHGSFRGHSVDDVYAELSNGKIDGLVLYSPPGDPLIPRLTESNLPVVAIADSIPSLPSVVVDDTEGMRLLVEHLAARGHRRILCRKVQFHTAASLSRRMESLHAAACAYGMTVIESALDEHWDKLCQSDEALLLGSEGERVTAVACWSDGELYRLLTQCRRLGLRVPQDLALVGFDGATSEVLPLLQPTTICASWAEVARIAVSLVVDQVEGKEVPPETVLPVKFVAGETT